MNELVDDLRAEISGGRCVVVVGTGVTAGATGRAAASSWPGLLSSGCRRAEALQQITAPTASGIRDLISRGTTGDLMVAADRIVDGLGGVESGEFGRWMWEDVGYLSRSIADDSVVRAIGNLDLPIMTTNYDDVIEKVLGRDYITWKNLPQFQRWMQAGTDDILHIHGHWKFADTIVLTNAQYAAHHANESLAALRQAAAATKSMLFVGFGEGLSDPSFGALRKWIEEQLPFQEFRHFRLCRSSEIETLARAHEGERIFALDYGPEYSDLGPFLDSLAPVSVDQARTPTTAFEQVEEQVRESAVLSAHVRHPDDARISDLLMPPVILPVPSEQFIQPSKAQDPSPTPKRCDLAEEVQYPATVLAGEEHSGVSSALLWLCGEMYLADTTLIPLLIDYRKLGGGHNPLKKSVVKKLRTFGYLLRETDELPRLLLVVDNVNAVNEQRLERMGRELQDPAYERVLIGCRTGSEAVVAGFMHDESGRDFRVRYVGRLGRADVRALAALMEPHRVDELTTQAARVVQTHGLTGTPFTLAMIITAILRGKSLMAASSPTSLLDAYIDLLLGRGASTDDPRVGFDAVNKVHILSRLSEVFVNRRVGALTEAAVVEELTKWLDMYGWSGQATDILSEFREVRILTVRNREVAFTQSSYLYVFAAKRAQREPAFLEVLKADPLYYAPILAHYAALQRSDFDLVSDLAPVLLKPFLELEVPRSKLFHRTEAESDGEDLDESFRREAQATPPEDAAGDDLAPLGRDPRDPDVPFPLEPVDDVPTIPRAIVTLGLVSNLIRDTEIVEDQERRRELFIDVLRTWTVLVDLIEHNDYYGTSLKEAAEAMADEMGIPPKHFTRFVEDLAQILPITVALAGISGTLSTSKLVRLIDACLDDPEFREDPALVVLTSHVLFDVNVKGWTKVLELLGEKYLSILAVGTIVRRMAFFAYIRRPQSVEDEQRLQDFLVGHSLLSVTDSRERAVRKTQALESLKRAKLLASRTPEDDRDQASLGSGAD